MRMRSFRAGLVLATAGSLALLAAGNVPLGVPGEWTWDRIPFDAQEWPAWLWGIASAALAGACYLGLLIAGRASLRRATRGVVCAWLLALSAAGFAWLWVVQESPARPGFELAKAAWVLYYPAREGYFDQARYVMRDVPSYLADYEKRMAEGDVLHLGTHPPGLMLFHRACLAACNASPPLCNALLSTQPESFRTAIEVTQEVERAGPRPLTSADSAALWLATLVTQLAAAGTVVPLYLLVRRDHSRTVAWWTAALWPLVPSLAIFLPKSDALFPVLGCSFLWLWLEGSRRRSWPTCLAAGAVFWLGIFSSLALVPVAFAAALFTVWESALCTPAERLTWRPRDAAACIVAALAGWAIPVALLRWTADINLLNVWAWNYRNHAAFYDQNVRTYWKWLLVNPLELALGLGVPLTFAACAGFFRTAKAGLRRRAMGPYWCCGATWALLWLSGKNEGEAARLWLVIMPWFVWMAAGLLASIENGRTDTEKGSWWGRGAVLLVALQMAVDVASVVRVTGFDFPNVPTAATVPAREGMPVASSVASEPHRAGRFPL